MRTQVSTVVGLALLLAACNGEDVPLGEGEDTGGSAGAGPAGSGGAATDGGPAGSGGTAVDGGPAGSGGTAVDGGPAGSGGTAMDGGSGTGGSAGSAGSGGSGGALCPGCEIVADVDKPQDMAMDATSIYWYGDNGIEKVAKGGGAVTQLGYPPFQVERISVDDTHVYYTTAYMMPVARSGVGKVPIGGGPLETVAGETEISAYPVAIATNGNRVFWGSYWDEGTGGPPQMTGAVRSVSTGGGTVTDLAIGAGAIAITLDSQYIYWSNMPWIGGLMRTPLGGGPVTPLATGECSDLKVDATDVYWVSSGGTIGQLHKMPKGGGSSTVVADLGLGPIALDQTDVYMIVGSQDQIVRVPKVGGPATVIAHGQLSPLRIVVDATHVYWTNWGTETGGLYNHDGAIVRIPK